MRRLAVLLLVCAGCGSHATTTPASPAPSSSTVPVLADVSGHVVLTDLAAVRYTSDGTHCTGVGRYADLTADALVTLSDLHGHPIVTTRLGDGMLRGSTATGRPGCSFPFSSTAVPNDNPALLVTVADQRAQRVTRTRLDAGTAVLRFG